MKKLLLFLIPVLFLLSCHHTDDKPKSGDSPYDGKEHNSKMPGDSTKSPVEDPTKTSM